MKIDQAKTKQDVISLFHTALIALIPSNQLDRIAQAILTKLLIERQEALPDPLDIPVEYSYDGNADRFTGIQIDDTDYDINR